MKVVAGWREAAAAAPVHFLVAVLAASLILTVLLVLLVSRGRSRFARWAMVLLYAVGLSAYAPLFETGLESAWMVVAIGLGLMQGAALAFLFTPSARAWLKAEADAPATETLERTFE